MSTNSRSDLVDIEVTLVHQTEKAWLVHDGDRKVWCPMSWGELERNEGKPTYTLTLPQAKAEELELV